MADLGSEKPVEPVVNVEDQIAENDSSNSTTEAVSGEAEVKNPKKPRRLLFITNVSLLVILGVLFWIFKEQIVGMFITQPVVSQTSIPKKELSQLDTQKLNDPELIKFITPTTGESWLPKPKDMSPQGWLKAELIGSYQDVNIDNYKKTAKQQLEENTPTYQEVGTRGTNTIVLVMSPSEGLGGIYYMFEKYPDGKAAVIVKPQAASKDSQDVLSNIKNAVSPKVNVIDQSTHYDSLNVPTKISLDKGEYVLRPENLNIWSNSFSSSDPGATLVAKLGSSSLYKTEKKYADTNLTNIGYYIETPLGTKIGLRYEPNKLSLEGYAFDNGAALQYKNTAGQQIYDELLAIARGCGGTFVVVTRTDLLKLSDLEQVGKSNAGREVYEPKDKNSDLYKKAYREYRDSGYDVNVSFDDYVKNHALVIMQNAKGDLLVYIRSLYAMSGGCAKPVVYLYPQSTRVVSVQVGANVTVSDPLYPSSGWTVLARPDGNLSYMGQQYDSLFWEGQGQGSYPSINSGTVVERADAAQTIRRQLDQQGLNAKEKADFMEFWESKIPNKPYIRLTWLTTEQMNALAPLRVNPKPDTVKRVFLDMDGFDKPLKLPAQKLEGFTRKGFTLVEWGGLTSEIRH